MDKNTLLAMLTQQPPQQQFDQSMLITNPQPVDMSTPQPQQVPLSTSQAVEFKTNNGFKPSYASQLDDEFYKQLQMRNDQVKQLQQDQTDLKNQPTTFADVNLRPALAFADSLMGTNTAYSYQAPKGIENRKEQMQKLQDAIMKSQNSIGDDQLNYLKMKANEESLKVREQSMLNAMNGRSEREESGVRKEYLNHPVIKGMKEVDQAASAIDNNQGLDGPSQQAMVFQFSKILDPDSVVREGEYAQSAANAGAINQARNYLNRLQTGQMLTQEQITQMKSVVKNLTSSYRGRVNEVNSYYEALSNRKGFDPRNVIVDPYIGSKSLSNKTGNADPSGKIKVSNGQETLTIEKADLQSAIRDGYKQVQ